MRGTGQDSRQRGRGHLGGGLCAAGRERRAHRQRGGLPGRAHQGDGRGSIQDHLRGRTLCPHRHPESDLQYHLPAYGPESEKARTACKGKDHAADAGLFPLHALRRGGHGVHGSHHRAAGEPGHQGLGYGAHRKTGIPEADFPADGHARHRAGGPDRGGAGRGRI